MRVINTYEQAKAFAKWARKNKPKDNRHMKIVDCVNATTAENLIAELVGTYYRTYKDWNRFVVERGMLIIIEEWDGTNTIYLFNNRKRG